MLYAFSAFLAYFVKGLCGFANTLVFSSILSFWQDNIYITPIDLPLSLISNLLLVFHDHKALSVKIWGSGAFFMILGIIPGTFFLKAGDPALIKIILGFLTMGLALQMLLKKKSAGGAGSALSHALIAILAGFISGLLGIGALISIYMARVTNSLEAFRGNLSLLFIMTNLFRFAIYIRTGILTADTFPHLGSFHAGRAFGRHHAFIPSRRDARPTRHHFLPASFRCRPCGDKSPHITAFPVVYLQQDHP